MAILHDAMVISAAGAAAARTFLDFFFAQTMIKQ